jgi:archaellum component FlaG (FlaF/FlaG flagellin family)
MRRGGPGSRAGTPAPTRKILVPEPRRIRPLLALALAGALVVATSPGAVAATAEGGTAWTVQTADNANGTGRGNFAYDAEPGAVIEDAMRVVNTGTETLPLAVYAADAFTTASGQIDVLVDGTPSEGAGTWVSIEPADLQLTPGQSADVAFRIAVPADARPGDHAAGIVTSLVSTDAAQSLSVDRRLGTRINIRVAGELVPAADVPEVSAAYTPSWNPFAPGILTLSYALENTGNTRLTGIETVSVAGPFAASAPGTQLPEVIPGSVIEVQREVPAFSFGWLSGAVEIAPEGVGLGAGSVTAITVDFSAPAVPWTLYALLLVVAGVVVAVVLLVRRRSRRGPADA